MKVVCLLGSPRSGGNSAAIARRFCAVAERLGAEVSTFALNELDYRGCQACMACKTKRDSCILEDDLTPVLESVREADLLLMASPVYFGEISSQLKTFVDRTYSYFVPDFHTNPHPSRLSGGKKVVFVLTQGQSDETRFADIYPKYEYFFVERFRFAESHLIRACGVRGAGEAEGRPEVLKLAEETALRLCRAD